MLSTAASPPLPRRRSEMSAAKVIEVIATQSVIGEGTEADPVRVVHELYSLDGRLLATHDSHSGVGFATNQIANPGRP